MKKENRGGARIGAGPKFKDDKKLNTNLHILKSRIEKLGIDKIKLIAIEAIEKEYNQK